MKYLESINLVQFFLYEREHVRISEITGLFGANGSGKSSFLDAVQIAMFGANSRLMALNAQADENKTTRSIRSYCLGQYGDTPEDRVRPRSNTYITLVWRDSETKKPVSMGVCIYAAEDSEQHKVLGRYLLPDVELTLGDHLETVDGKEKPREWNAFKQQLLQRSKVSGEECVFEEAERYIRACLLELRGSGGAPSYDAFVRAFRFALRMRFDKTVDEIVRNDVLESRPTNIKKFKDVTESFRRLAELVANVEQKINDGSAVESVFGNAAKASRKAVTWKTLGLDVALEQANQTHNEAQGVMDAAREAFEAADKAFKQLATDHTDAVEKSRHYRRLREQHTSHADYAGLESQIRADRGRAERKKNDIVNQLSHIRNFLKNAAEAPFLDADVTRNLHAESKKLAVLLERFGKAEWLEIEAHLQTAVQASEKALQDLNAIGGALNDQLITANDDLKNAEKSLERVKQGKTPLSPHVETLMRELRDEGLSPVAVCDLVKITKNNGSQDALVLATRCPGRIDRVDRLVERLQQGVADLQLTDIVDGRLTLSGRVIPLAGPARVRLAAWLDHRARTWPGSANPHLFINRKTAPRLTRCGRYFPWVRAGISPQALREDRILQECHATGGDVRRICDLFGLTVDAALRYASTLGHADLASDHASGSETHDPR